MRASFLKRNCCTTTRVAIIIEAWWCVDLTANVSIKDWDEGWLSLAACWSAWIYAMQDKAFVCMFLLLRARRRVIGFEGWAVYFIASFGEPCVSSRMIFKCWLFLMMLWQHNKIAPEKGTIVHCWWRGVASPTSDLRPYHEYAELYLLLGHFCICMCTYVAWIPLMRLSPVKRRVCGCGLVIGSRQRAGLLTPAAGRKWTWQRAERILQRNSGRPWTMKTETTTEPAATPNRDPAGRTSSKPNWHRCSVHLQSTSNIQWWAAGRAGTGTGHWHSPWPPAPATNP